MNEEKENLMIVFTKVIKALYYKNKIQRYEKTYITLKNDENNIMYCSVCWDKDIKLIQVDKRKDGRFSCPNCKQYSCYDEELARATSVINHNKCISDFIRYNDVMGRR